MNDITNFENKLIHQMETYEMSVIRDEHGKPVDLNVVVSCRS